MTETTGLSEFLCTGLAVDQHSGIRPSKCTANCSSACLNDLWQPSQFLLALRIARYKSFSVASSVGMCPLIFNVLRSWRFNDSIALVV